MLVSDLNTIHPLDCLVVAQVRSECADLACFYDRGYIRYWDGTKIMLREHQRVALVAYGPISGFHVHHIDSNTLNNRADNLAVLSPSEHQRLHGVAYRRRSTLECPICHRPFEAIRSRAVKRGVKFCSAACRQLADRRVERPSRLYLAELMTTVRNFCELGRMFGVSDNAVRKWARAYGLDLSVCDGRLKR